MFTRVSTCILRGRAGNSLAKDKPGSARGDVGFDLKRLGFESHSPLGKLLNSFEFQFSFSVKWV